MVFDKGLGQGDLQIVDGIGGDCLEQDQGVKEDWKFEQVGEIVFLIVQLVWWRCICFG